MKCLLFCVVFFLQFIMSDAIMCYQCDDSTDKREIADCTFHTRTLAQQRSQLDKGERQITQLSYLKNCSTNINENGETVFKYCKIEILESFGTVNAYLRDCSDGTNFAPLNVTRLGYLRADNQTTCGFSQLQGVTQCIKLCDTDFCNGPFAQGTRMSASMLLVLIAIVICVMGHLMT